MEDHGLKAFLTISLSVNGHGQYTLEEGYTINIYIKLYICNM